LSFVTSAALPFIRLSFFFIDLILGFPWLTKDNPHVDWRRNAYQFTRNSRRYKLYPQRVKRTFEQFNKLGLYRLNQADHFPESLSVAGESLIASASEFNDFVDDSTHLFLMQRNSKGGKEKVNFKPTTGSERRKTKRQTVESPKGTQSTESPKVPDPWSHQRKAIMCHAVFDAGSRNIARSFCETWDIPRS